MAVINEIAREQTRTGEKLDTAVGFRGTVAIGFYSADDLQRVVAIITGRCNPARYRRTLRGTGIGRSGIDGIAAVSNRAYSFVF